MYFTGLFITTACLFTQVVAQEVETMRWNQVCDDTLVLCEDNYKKGVQNKETTIKYKNCVYNVFCEQWSEGYYTRQNKLSEIQGRMEFYDPESTAWWKNGSRSYGISFSAGIISACVVVKILHSLAH